MRAAWLATLFLIGPVWAAEPLPPPRPLPPEIVIYPPTGAPGYFPQRVSAYEVWQHMGTTSQGRFRPRVLLFPEGDAYYSFDGAPFPWTTSSPRRFMPYVD